MDSLLDTDILSEILKRKNLAVVQKAPAYLQIHQQFAFSAITRYEIVRGLKDKKAIRQFAQFAVFCQHSNILAITDDILDRAADLWVTARQQSLPNPDVDLIIAAIAIVHIAMCLLLETLSISPGFLVYRWRIGASRE